MILSDDDIDICDCAATIIHRYFFIGFFVHLQPSIINRNDEKYYTNQFVPISVDLLCFDRFKLLFYSKRRIKRISFFSFKRGPLRFILWFNEVLLTTE